MNMQMWKQYHIDCCISCGMSNPFYDNTTINSKSTIQWCDGMNESCMPFPVGPENVVIVFDESLIVIVCAVTAIR